MKIAIYKDTFANNRGADIAVKNLAGGNILRKKSSRLGNRFFPKSLLLKF